MGQFICLICQDGGHACLKGYSNVWDHLAHQNHFMEVGNYDNQTYKFKKDCDEDHILWLKRCGLCKKHDGLTKTKLKRVRDTATPPNQNAPPNHTTTTTAPAPTVTAPRPATMNEASDLQHPAPLLPQLAASQDQLQGMLHNPISGLTAAHYRSA